MFAGRVLLLAGVLVGCSRGLPEPIWQVTPEPQLNGAWLLELQVTGKYSGSSPKRAKGAIALRCKVAMEPGAIQRPCTAGYAVQLGDSALRRMIGPEVSGAPWAMTDPNGLVELWFNPNVDHGAFRLRGVARGDSVIGEWARGSFIDDGYTGRFVLARRF